jgi:hypothetical protein
MIHRYWNRHSGRHRGIFVDAVAPREEGQAGGGGVGATPAGVGGDVAMVGRAPGATGGALPPPDDPEDASGRLWRPRTRW